MNGFKVKKKKGLLILSEDFDVDEKKMFYLDRWRNYSIIKYVQS